MKIDKSWYVKPKFVKNRIAAGGVVVRIIDGQVKILMVCNDVGTDWVLPKGGVEQGENLEQAARREIQEEAGATDLKLIGELGTKERLTFEKDYWSLIHYFLFYTDKENGKPTEASKNYITKWSTIDDLPYMFWPEQKELIEENREKIIKLVTDNAK